MNIEKNKQYLFLQFLRAYAAFLVIYEHLFGGYLKTILYKDNIYNDFISNYLFLPIGITDHGGSIGVVQFFLLSGFIITMVAMRENRMEFLLKRSFRIFPPILFSLTIISILYIILIYLNMNNYINIHSQQWPSIVSTDDFGIISLLKNLSLIKVDLNGVMWTLRVEILFYFMIFLLLPYLKRNATKTYFILFIFYAILYIFNIYAIELFGNNSGLIQKIYIQFEYVPFLFLGSLFYLKYEKRISFKSFIFFSSFFIFILFNNPLSSYIFLTYLLIVIGIYFNNQIKVNKVLIFFGNISYSSYLNHQTIGTILIGIWISKFGYSDDNMLIVFMSMLLLILSISIFSYNYIEKPSQKLARYILKRFNNEK